MPSSASRGSCLVLRAVLAPALAIVMVAGCAATDVDQTTPGGRYSFSGVTAAGQVIEPSGRQQAPPFSGELLDGASFESSSLVGDVAVINFWGSWCAPCRIETPDLQEVYADLRDDEARFLGVAVKDQRSLAEAFMSSVGAQYPSLFDPRGEVALAFRGFPANVVPSTILLDRRGRVAGVYAGVVTQPDLRAALRTLLQEPA